MPTQEPLSLGSLQYRTKPVPKFSGTETFIYKRLRGYRALRSAKKFPVAAALLAGSGQDHLHALHTDPACCRSKHNVAIGLNTLTERAASLVVAGRMPSHGHETETAVSHALPRRGKTFSEVCVPVRGFS